MARQRNASEDHENNDPTDPQATPDLAHDVLVMVSRGGAIEAIWNGTPARREGTDALIPQQFRHRLEPGLSFCPGRLWPRVSATPSYVRGVKDGDIIPVAGHQGDLAKGLAALGAIRLAALVTASHHVESLRRLQELEEQGPARKPVLEAIEARMEKLAAQVRRDENDHAERRRATHARQTRRRLRGF